MALSNDPFSIEGDPGISRNSGEPRNLASNAPATSPSGDSASSQTAACLRLLRNGWKFRSYLFIKLPSAYFSGIRVREIDGEHCKVTVPYKWFTQNPFRSTYFACQAMAAEMSTGALAMAHSYRHDPPISMLVVSLEANYFKKATGTTSFLCSDGAAILDTIRMAVSSGEGRTIRARSVGTNSAGEPVAEFLITWSFKAKLKH